MDLLTNIQTASDYILKRSKYKPEIGLILGSGLGALANLIFKEKLLLLCKEDFITMKAIKWKRLLFLLEL